LDAFMLEYRVLGPFEVLRDGVPVEVGGAKPRALLALLLLESGRAVSTRRLTDDLWSPAPPSSAKALQVYISQLRKALGSDVIETREDAYLLRTTAASFDLTQFEELVDAGRSQIAAGRTAEGAAALDEAIGLWRGDALDGLDEPGLAPFRARLDELRLVVHELWNDARLETGHSGTLLPELTMLARRNPLRERFQEQLMLALYRSGRQAEALGVYRGLREQLNDELGLEPRERLRRLEQAILRQDAELEAKPAPDGRRAVVAAGAHPSRLAALGAPLAQQASGELILLTPVEASDALAPASALLEPERSDAVRVATFVSRTPVRDVLRLAADEDAELVVLETSGAALTTAPAPELAGAACDIAFFVDAPGDLPGAQITVLFGGAAEDWKAVEIAAVLARSCGLSLRLLGVEDASTLLARAALVVQRFVGVATQPALFDPRDPQSPAVAATGGTMVAGISGWSDRGLSPARLRLLEAGVPLLLVRGGPRPSLLAPARSLTLFSWSLLG
jgi:DNA-binding SARP family transcriptional activator